jgi:hypothetical protein
MMGCGAVGIGILVQVYVALLKSSKKKGHADVWAV